jgi:hypothetical protein
MAATISLTEQQTLTALRTVLLGILPDGTPVIRSEVNRVAEPSESDFCMLTPILRTRLATNTDSYIDAPFATPPVGLRNSLNPMQITVQLDVHGPASADNAQMISTLFRDEYACIQFAATGFDVQPLYAEDPRQTPFENAEQQTEYRWSVDVVLQANPVISTAQDFADVVVIDAFEADAAGAAVILVEVTAVYGRSRYGDGSIYR